jgi:hypothetical protein
MTAVLFSDALGDFKQEYKIKAPTPGALKTFSINGSVVCFLPL